MLKVATITILMLTGWNTYAQTGQNVLGNWLMYLGSNRVSDKFSIHTELQYRNHTPLPVEIKQLLIRTGVNYHLSSSALVSGGYGFIASHNYESLPKYPESEEHRIWQQFITIQQLNRIKLEHRYRLEQRWVNANYKNRFRYRLMLFIPINKPKIEKGTFFLGLYDEVFINGEKVFFDRNRLYGAIGYQLNVISSFQLGLLRQQVNDFAKTYLQFLIVVNPDFRKNL